MRERFAAAIHGALVLTAAVLVAFLSTRFGFERDLSHANGASLSPASVALDWVRSQAGISSTLIGARRLDQLRANLDSLEVTLSAEQINKLSLISKPKLNFPAENNETLAPMLAFPGTTVDGRTVPSPARLSA